MKLARSALALINLLLAGCSTGPVRLDNRHVEPSLDPHSTPSCRLAPFELTDGRPAATLGRTAVGDLSYPEMLPWLQSVLARSTTEDATLGPLQIELMRAYIESHPSSHTFQVVLRARSASDESSAWRVYRGSNGGITWWGTDREYGEYVERASLAAVEKLIRAEGQCATAKKTKTRR